MTAKDKAKELVEKMLGDNNHYLNQNIEIDKLIAKQCALICVDNTIEALWNVGHSSCNDEIEYHREVEKEIEKL